MKAGRQRGSCPSGAPRRASARPRASSVRSGWTHSPLLASLLVSCAADGPSLFEEECCQVETMGGAPGLGGTGGASLPPSGGLDTAGSSPIEPAGGTRVTQPAPTGMGTDMGMVESRSPSDAGEPSTLPNPSLDAGSGVADADLSSPGPVVSAACVGLALELDGSTFATVPLAIQTDFTLEAWIKTTASLAGASAFSGRAFFDADVVGMGDQSDFLVSVLNDRVAFAIGDPDTSVQGLEGVTNDEWVHVAVTRQASTGELRIIQNGQLEAVATAANRGPMTGRPDMALGGFVATRRFIGAIDEVRVWGTVRSVEQIAANRHARLSAPEPGLVGYYPFDDQGSVTTADGSPRALAATFTGTPSYVASTALCASE